MVQIPLLLAQTSSASLFWTLGWAFLIAAFIWLIIWWLLHPRSERQKTDRESRASHSSPTATATAAPISAPSPGSAPTTAAGKPKVIEIRKHSSPVPAPKPEKAAATAPAPDSAKPGDDLTRLGISEELAKDFAAAGITRFEQIADWSADDLASHVKSLGEKYPGTNFGDLSWRARALADGVDPATLPIDSAIYGPPHRAPETVDHAGVIAREFVGEKVLADKDLGIVYEPKAVPGHEDELRSIKGVGPKLETELHAHGVFCLKQIAAWSDHNVSEFADRLKCFKGRIERDRWIPQAKLLKCAEADGGLPDIGAATEDEAAAQFRKELDSGSARQDDVYGIVYTTAPGSPDDLKKIKGVATVLEGKLNEIGVYQYRQIAFWTKPAVKEFSKLLTSFKDRIYRDNWIAQAKTLHEEKYGKNFDPEQLDASKRSFECEF